MEPCDGTRSVNGSRRVAALPVFRPHHRYGIKPVHSLARALRPAVRISDLKGSTHILFGSGSTAAVALQELERLGVDVDLVFDNDAAKWGTSFFGRRVVRPRTTPRLVLIATDSAKAVGLQLREMGIGFTYVGPFVDYENWDAYFSDIPEAKWAYLQTLFDEPHSREILHSVAVFRRTADPTHIIQSRFAHYEHPQLPIKRGDVVIDAGAWVGDTAEAFAHRVGPAGKVISFEPNRDAARQIDPANALVHVAGLSDQSGTGVLKSTEPTWGGSNASGHRLVSNVDDDESDGVKVRLVALDDLALERCDVIKMDIEGSGLDALEGARKTIRTHQPNLMISAYHKFADLWEIPKTILTIAPYCFYLGHHSDAAVETVLYGRSLSSLAQ